mgnify:CR=1 FL=1
MPTLSSIQFFTHLGYQSLKELCFPLWVVDASQSHHRFFLLTIDLLGRLKGINWSFFYCLACKIKSNKTGFLHKLFFNSYGEGIVETLLVSTFMLRSGMKRHMSAFHNFIILSSTQESITMQYLVNKRVKLTCELSSWTGEEKFHIFKCSWIILYLCFSPKQFCLERHSNKRLIFFFHMPFFLAFRKVIKTRRLETLTWDALVDEWVHTVTLVIRGK